MTRHDRPITSHEHGTEWQDDTRRGRERRREFEPQFGEPITDDAHDAFAPITRPLVNVRHAHIIGIMS